MFLKILSISLLFASFVLFSEESTNEEERVERLQVTGSYISRIDVEGPFPLDIIDREEFDLLGSATIAEALKQHTAFEAVFENVGHVRFRGQHAGNVLILLNGMRLPKQGGGYYTSINGIPTSAVERVEMVKDGGSALYGSDAMAGIMNFITRDQFHGGELSFNTTRASADRGAQNNFSGSIGRNFARGNILGVVQYEESKGYDELDLGSFNNDPRYVHQKRDTFQVGTGANTQRFGPTGCENGSNCLTNPLQYDQVRPDTKNLSTLVTTRYDFGEVDLRLLGLFNRRQVESRNNPRSLFWVDQSSSGGANTALLLSDISPGDFRDRVVANNLANSDGYVNISGNFFDQFGEYQTKRTDDSFGLQSQLSGYLGDYWSWQFDTGLSGIKSETEILSGEIDQNRFRQQVLDGLVDFSPTDGVIFSPGAGDLSINPSFRNKGQMLTAKAVATGEIFHLNSLYQSGGVVNLAFGIEGQNEKFKFYNDEALIDGTTLTSPARNYSGNRDVLSAFMEISAFIMDNLELQLAQRIDNYSDVGSTYNPKMALAYRPINPLMLRSSIGTGFRAPGITDLYAGEESFPSRFRDQANCDSEGNCPLQFYDVTTYTTEDTKPEDSLHYSFGAVYQPTRALSLTVDQWNFHGKNTLSAIRAQEFTFIENEFGAGALADAGVEVVRDSDGNLLSIRHPRVSNMGSRELRGLDVELSARFDLGRGLRFGTGVSHSHIITRDTKKFDFSPVEKGDQSWRNRLFTNMGFKQHFFQLSASTVSSDTVGFGALEQKLPQYTEYDFSYNFRTSWSGKFNLVVRNIANSRPPVEAFVDGTRYGNTSRNYSAFSPLRRRVFLGYSQTF